MSFDDIGLFLLHVEEFLKLRGCLARRRFRDLDVSTYRFLGNFCTLQHTSHLVLVTQNGLVSLPKKIDTMKAFIV